MPTPPYADTEVSLEVLRGEGLVMPQPRPIQCSRVLSWSPVRRAVLGGGCATEPGGRRSNATAVWAAELG